MAGCRHARIDASPRKNCLTWVASVPPLDLMIKDGKKTGPRNRSDVSPEYQNVSTATNAGQEPAANPSSGIPWTPEEIQQLLRLKRVIYAYEDFQDRFPLSQLFIWTSGLPRKFHNMHDMHATGMSYRQIASHWPGRSVRIVSLRAPCSYGQKI